MTKTALTNIRLDTTHRETYLAGDRIYIVANVWETGERVTVASIEEEPQDADNLNRVSLYRMEIDEEFYSADCSLLFDSIDLALRFCQRVCA